MLDLRDLLAGAPPPAPSTAAGGTVVPLPGSAPDAAALYTLASSLDLPGTLAEAALAAGGPTDLARARLESCARLAMAADLAGCSPQAAALLPHVAGGGMTERQARDQLLAARSAAAAGPGEIFAGHTARGSYDDPLFRARAVSAALSAQLDNTEPPPEARPFMGLSAAELVGLRPAFGPTAGTGMLTTSDFPLIAGTWSNERARRAYAEAAPALRTVARRLPLPDFKPAHVLAAGSIPIPQKINEHGEVKSVALPESGGVWTKLETYASLISLTRQLILNDRLRLIDERIQRAVRAAITLESSILTTVLQSNPAFADDGVDIFHADHGNLAASGAPPSVETLAAAFLALRTQKDLGGEVFIDLTPTHLICGPEIEVTARQALAQITPAVVEEVNPFSGQLELLVEPRITGTNWYVVAGRNADGLAYAVLDGQSLDARYGKTGPGPEVRIESPIDVDGVACRILHDFAAGWLDYRSWYKNPGS